MAMLVPNYGDDMRKLVSNIIVTIFINLHQAYDTPIYLLLIPTIDCYIYSFQ